MAGLAGARGAWRLAGPRHDPGRYLAALVLVGVAYYVGARVGLTLSLVERNVTPLWPPTGIAVVAFLLGGRAMWPGVFVAALAVNLPISEGPLPAAITAVGNTLAPLVAAVLLGRVGFRRQLDRRRDALAIVFLGALASTLLSATIGAATLVLSGAIGSDQLPTAVAVWWTGDAMGVLTVAPFLLSLPLFRDPPRWPPARWLEAVTILVLAALTTTWAARSDLGLLYLVIPIVGWASWRLQLRGAAPVALVVSLIATWFAARGEGLIASESLFEQMFTLQTFNACVALTSFFLAAMVTEQRSEAQEQLSQEEARARREHEIAETLQRSLLPDRIPQMPSVDLAARYVPATADMEVGGDWYDVIPLRDGLVGLAIGDVAGHGLHAAATMGQLRMALRAYAVQDPSPVSVMRGVHELVSHLPMSEMVTLIYLVFDPATRTLRFTNAGHPPPLVFGGGESRYLEDGLAPPLGVTVGADLTECTHEIQPGATVLLYTDGLVERRSESIQVGLDRLLLEAAGHEDTDVDVLCEHILSALTEPGRVNDDIALVAMRPLRRAGGPLHLALAAEPRVLVEARQALRLWLRDSGVATDDESEVLIACGEACANVVRHAYATAAGEMVLDARIEGDVLEVTVADQGQWRPPADRGGGWGLQLIHGLMDSVDVAFTADGTLVRMRRRLQAAGDR
jgi:serine phosphatase RsbU (regulator of sigma subunit)/integral membrane sensor domain MASE1/anti-sigma regulatory factor (Ser/Thr protein kinase)